jgi:hypothetical protein
MPSSRLHIPAAHRLPVQCVLYMPHEKRQGPGTIMNLSMDRCHMETRMEVCPGMIVALYLLLPNAPQDIAIERAMVTWARRGECGIQMQCLQPAEANQLQDYLTVRAC